MLIRPFAGFIDGPSRRSERGRLDVYDRRDLLCICDRGIFLCVCDCGGLSVYDYGVRLCMIVEPCCVGLRNLSVSDVAFPFFVILDYFLDMIVLYAFLKSCCEVCH